MPDYQAFIPAQRFQRRVSLSADGTMVAYSSDASGQFNLWTRATAGGPARQLTYFTDQAVRDISWSPDSSMIAFTADIHGDEQTQLYLIPSDGGRATRLSTTAGRQYTLAEKTPFDRTGRYLFCGGNDRDPAIRDLIVYDTATGSAQRFEGLTDAWLFPLAIAPDGQNILAGGTVSNTECRCYLAQIADPHSLKVLTSGLPGSYFYPGPWQPDSEGFYLRTTTGSDRTALGRFSLRDQTMTVIDAPPWDVEDVTASHDGHTVIWTVNEDGRSVLYGRRPGRPMDLPALPAGVIEAMDISADGSRLAVLLDTPSRPLDVAVIDTAGPEAFRYLTDARPAAVRSGQVATPQFCHYPAADGTPVPALLHRPHGPGPHPVVMSIHGGPEQQARPYYDALYQCLLSSGIAVFEPNVRGSSGYGHAWQARIYRDWGGIDLDDFKAGAEYLQSLDGIDPARLAVMGLSYGGFAALSCISRLPGLWAAGVSICGPANLESLARSMPPDWAHVVDEMFGNPDSHADELRRRSPVTYASQIKAPLLIIQGANDPRVPRAEAEQIVESARTNGIEVSYLVFDDEGHGFTNRDNDIKAHTAVAEFLVKHLNR